MFRRIVVCALIAVGVLAAAAGPAGAHVSVTSDDAEPGKFAVITFRVPNEESAADTVGVKIQMPADHPIAFVSVQPKPGWTAETETTKLDNPLVVHGDSITDAVSEVEWTGGAVAPGGFDEFKIQAGPLPEGVDELTFKAIQTYADSDGKTEEVAWIQESTPGDPEPEHPAPVLKLTAGGPDAGTAGDGAPSATAAESDSGGDSGTSTGFVVAAMAFGASGLAMGVFALILAVAARHKVGLIARDAGIGKDDT